ncbi:MAG TPA: hybrid sensor histidine kinase/response regulator [Candidatus Atribacteria bacterium]|nr:hybrid sensor histidine kinase/response regulator [Candidatus Atribacteria bacterium]
MKIGVKFIVIIEVLVLISISVIGFMSYYVGTESIKGRIEAQLESVMVLKTIHLNNFFRERKEDVQSLSNYCSELLAEEKYEHTVVREKLKERLNENSFFFEFFIIDLDGRISVSTDEKQEGKLKSNERYFIDGKNNITVQSFYYDLSLQQPAITVASPIKENNEITIGVLAGRVDLTEVSFILTERSGLGETGETYLVHNFNYAVTQLRDEETPSFKTAVYTQVVKKCLKEKPSNVQFMSDYLNYAEERVMGAYAYLPELQVCLIAEINEAEAFAPLVDLRNTLFFTVSFVAVIAVVLGYFISKTVTKPIKKLSDMAKKISSGDLNVVVNVDSKDEIGDLAKSFNTMRISLKKTRQSLLDAQNALERKVEERTKELNEKVVKLEKSEAAALNLMEDLQETLKKLEKSHRTIELKNIQLKKLDKIKSDFLNITSHELRTPMSAIKGYAQMLLKGVLGEVTDEQKKALEVVVRSTDRLDRLIQDILDVSRLESGTMKFIPKQTDVKKMVMETVEVMQSSANSKDIKINVEVEDNIPKLVIDQERIQQVIINLLNNAIKFSQGKSVINVRVKKQKDEVLFEVQDFGKGIPKNKQKKIFDTFYQVDSGMDRKFGGAGLGLAICRGIVLSHGGKIWVESTGIPEEGSTFRFTLPLKPVQDVEGRFREVDIVRINSKQSKNKK